MRHKLSCFVNVQGDPKVAKIKKRRNRRKYMKDADFSEMQRKIWDFIIKKIYNSNNSNFH